MSNAPWPLLQDDLEVRAVRERWSLAKGGRRAPEAGCDLLLVCSDVDACFQLLRLSKFVFLVDQAVVGRARNDEFLNGLFAKERWANVNVSDEVFRSWVRDIDQGDAILRGTLAGGASTSVPSRHRCM